MKVFTSLLVALFLTVIQAQDAPNCDAAVQEATAALTNAQQDTLAKLEQATKSLHESERVVGDLRAEVGSVVNARDSIQNELNQARARAEEIAGEKNHFQREAEEYKVGMEKAEEESKVSQAQVSEVKARVASLEKGLAEARSKVSVLQQELEVKTTKIRNLESVTWYELLQKEIKALWMKLSSKDDSSGDL